MNIPIKEIVGHFDTRADFLYAHPYGSGHINDTFCGWYDSAGVRIRLIHQRINATIFSSPNKLMENISRVTSDALQELKKMSCPEAHRRTLTLIPSVSGENHVVDAEGYYWRTYPFIDRARTHDVAQSPAMAEHN